MNLEYKISSIEKNNLALRDSVDNLTKIIQKADIKTSFFSDQLSFQLYVVSFFVAIAGLVSWKSLLSPFANKVNKAIEDIKRLNQNVIPENINKIEEKIKEMLEKVDAKIESSTNNLENQIDKVNSRANDIMFKSLESSVRIFSINQRWHDYFYYKLKTVEFLFSIDEFDAPDSDRNIVKILEELEDVLIKENLEFKNMTAINNDIFNILDNILAEHCDQSIKYIAQKIFDKISTPSP